MKPIPELFLIDGDVIKDKNCERQFFKGVVGKTKANALAEIVAAKFPEVPVHPIASFLNKDTLRAHRNMWLKAPVLILAGLDNNDSRCILEDQVNLMKDVVLISGGNEVTDGQVHIFARKSRKNLTPTLTQIAPEVRHNRGVAPGTAGHCLEEGASDPQTALINRAVSVAMEMSLGYFMNGTGFTIKKPPYNEIRIDVETGTMKGFWRDPVPGLETPKRRR